MPRHNKTKSSDLAANANMKPNDVRIGNNINPSSLEGPENPADAFLKTDAEQEMLDQDARIRNRSGVSGTRGAENVRAERVHMKKAGLKNEEIKHVRNKVLPREKDGNFETSL